MENTFLIITSIASDKNPVLCQFAKEAAEQNVPFIVIGDKKSPEFHLEGCDFYSVERQVALSYKLSKLLPFRHYARKNLGYLEAINKGAEIIIETDDDNYPTLYFWKKREIEQNAYLFKNKGWLNIYEYYTSERVWPRGFSLEDLQNERPTLERQENVYSPIHQGLADDNPDVDAIYRLITSKSIHFNKEEQRIALGKNTICPFNSQNTTWFREAFPLLYLPYYCSFRMTDIWRSFVAQRIAWTCGWSILFHEATVWQERNDHALIKDFKDEISGYCNNREIMDNLCALDLKEGLVAIPENMMRCYHKMIEMQLVGKEELSLLEAWIEDVVPLNKK